MPSKKKKIGILGGTFDPIHWGHLILAEQAAEKFQLNKVIFIPCAHPPHKKGKKISPAKKRWDMVKLAIQGNPKFLVSDLEIKRGGYSYTVDTLTQLKKIYPKSELYFLTGSDMLKDIYNWRKPEKIYKLAKLVIAFRPSFDKINRKNKFVLKSLFLEIPAVDISSTQIREKIKNKESIKYLVHPEVERYIKKKRLYK
jgi:nicotinate-nucleotide adenylyltransferase